MKEDYTHILGQISAISYSHWEELFAYIVDFEKTKEFGKWTEAEQSPEGIFMIPHCIYTPLVNDFVHHVYTIDLIFSFDWMQWQEGQEILSDSATDFD